MDRLRDMDCYIYRSVRTLIFVFTTTLLLSGCEQNDAANARRLIVQKHAPRVAQIVIQDIQRHFAGLEKAATRIAPGFVRVQGAQQEKDIRKVLRLIRHPIKGVEQLIITPMSFIAAVDKNGVVIARDTEPDRMKGMNLAELFPVVKQALSGEQGYAVGQFRAMKKGEQPSVTIIMAVPSRYQNEVVGGLVVGIPLWRLAQRLSRQLQAEHAGKGVVLWVYVYRGEKLYHYGTPHSMDELVPSAEERRKGLSKSPGGFTGEVAQFGSFYGFGVRPIRILGDDIGVVIFRMDPK
ncbi:MAG: cache domain-containing protein [Deltaproteobacteria bacterium]|nr:cache domain-containing protein [Deltaproteobacteria bacterium]